MRVWRACVVLLRVSGETLVERGADPQMLHCL